MSLFARMPGAPAAGSVLANPDKTSRRGSVIGDARFCRRHNIAAQNKEVAKLGEANTPRAR
jgi:hypothetical protein